MCSSSSRFSRVCDVYPSLIRYPVLIAACCLPIGDCCLLMKVNAEHKKLNEANEGSAIFLEELDKV